VVHADVRRSTPVLSASHFAPANAAADLAAWMQPRVSRSIGGLVMNRMLLLFAMIATTLGTATVARAQTQAASDESPFRFQFEESKSHRGVAVEGYVYNALPWRITNVRLQLDSIDANGTLMASASGWVLGDVPAGGRGYFYVPVSAHAATYRASVQAFHKVMLETAAPQAP
jgi:hypothetical protein